MWKKQCLCPEGWESSTTAPTEWARHLEVNYSAPWTRVPIETGYKPGSILQPGWQSSIGIHIVPEHSAILFLWRHNSCTTQPFTVYSSVVFSIFIKLCNHHHYLILEHFHHLKEEISYPLAVTPYSTLFQSLEITNLLSDMMDLLFLDISFKWNHTTYGFLWPVAWN